jgi:hypothetical protein
MLEYIEETIDRHERIAAAVKAAKTWPPPGSAGTDLLPQPPALAPAVESIVPPVPAVPSSALPPLAVIEATFGVGNKVLGQDELSEQQERDTPDSDDAIVDSEDEDGAMPLLHANTFLHATIKSCQGDAEKLKREITRACESGEVELGALKRVVDDNIAAATTWVIRISAFCLCLRSHSKFCYLLSVKRELCCQNKSSDVHCPISQRADNWIRRRGSRRWSGRIPRRGSSSGGH